MFDTDFLKQLTLLYVEDDELARTQLSKILSRLFKNVIQAKNGLEGYNTFQENKNSNDDKIDLILSDINMPKLNGIEMLEKIRNDKDDIPIIFTTARNETEYLLKAISLNANHYAIKPIDKEDVILKIQEVCEKKYYQELVRQKSKELKEYLKIINGVASITKMNEEGKITFANEYFCETSLYEKNEILEKTFEELLSNDIDKNLIAQIWQNIKDGQTWKNDLKYLDKNGHIFFIKSTIFKINKGEYINIGFISTSDVNEKREFKKKIIQNIKDKNIEVANANKILSQIEDKSTSCEVQLNALKDRVIIERDKHKKAESQIKYYENKILNVDDKVVKNLKAKNILIDDLNKNLASLKKTKDDNNETIQKLSKDLLQTKVQIEELEEKIVIKEKRVENLSQVIELRENQIKKLDPTLLELNV